ncbi:metallophosphoesterase [Fundidesulfovibrio soli]|uniref:metallophosphoesterase n=1 Tax=Fundidesulfovibrio soli TaxID=2922716 RepID=UPI001FB01616|nr:metallophosphoesterase [Fundidesulfovibrio soli]
MDLLDSSQTNVLELSCRVRRRDFLRVALSGAALLAAPAICGGFSPAWAAKNQSRPANPVVGAVPADVCTGGDPASFTAASADRAGMFLLFSDVHFNPFADPGKVKALAAAPAAEWGAILADAAPVYSPYGQDSNNALFQSFLDDMASRAPRPDFLLFPGDLLCHGFWTLYPRLTGDSSSGGLLGFIGKTAEYFLAEVTRRFPEAPLYLALGNNDSFEGDFRIVPDSPYLSVTASSIAQRALKSEADRAAFLESYPRYGCYSLPLPGHGGRIVVFNNIYWAKRYPNQGVGKPVLDFLTQELATAGRRGEKVWLMAHVPPGDNSKSSAAKYLKTGKNVYAPLLADAWNDALANLLVAHSQTVRASFCGHVHRDEFRLVYPKGRELPAASLRLGPSISPVTGNNPGYQVYSYDRQSFELLDTAVHYLDIGASRPAWEVEYTYSRAYGRGLRSPGDWQAMYQELKTCSGRRKTFEEAFDLRSTHIDEVNGRTFPIYWDALGVTAQTSI